MSSPPVRSSAASAPPAANRAVNTTASGPNGGFDDLWTTSLAGVGGQALNASSGNSTKKSMLDLDREKTMNSLWNAPGSRTSAPSAGQTKPSHSAGNHAFDDLLG